MKNQTKLHSLSALIEYQSDSVVSKTLIKKNGGTITLFAFDKGQGLSKHTAPFEAFVYIICGEAEVTISGNIRRLSEGEFVIMPANEPHALMAIERFKMMLVMIKE